MNMYIRSVAILRKGTLFRVYSVNRAHPAVSRSEFSNFSHANINELPRFTPDVHSTVQESVEAPVLRSI